MDVVEARRELTEYPLLTSRAAWTGASDLILRFGGLARTEAATRADQSRLNGNLIAFCHWRCIEHAIGVLNGENAAGTLH